MVPLGCERDNVSFYYILVSLLSKQHGEEAEVLLSVHNKRNKWTNALAIPNVDIYLCSCQEKPRENMCKCVINVAINSADTNDDNDTLHFMYGLPRLIAIIANCTC